MAMERKRLRVDGIPNDITATRMKDKLTIYFLRSRNGGGEVESVDIIQGNPTYAIVMFEDDEVVKNVLKIKDHTLQISDKLYFLLLSEVTSKVELEEVFPSLSLTVNYRKFPENCQSLLKNLMQTRKYVVFDFDEKSTTCTINGTYAEIQTLAQEILSKLGIVYPTPKQYSSDARRRARMERRKNYPEPHEMAMAANEPLCGSEEIYNEKPESLEQLQEPFVWDSDIFKYIKKFHSYEYRAILNCHQILAVEENFGDITTIYLETKSWVKTSLADLRSARCKLMGLYRGLELVLRKEQISKRDVCGDQQFYKTLASDFERIYPMLLFHEDEQFLYLIGNAVEVGHGRQYISDLHAKFDKMSIKLDKQLGAGNGSNVSEGSSHSLSPTNRESRVEKNFAAIFSPPTTHSPNPSKSHVGEKYLVPGRRRLLERERELAERASLTSTEPQKIEALSPSQRDEKSESPSIKRPDVLPALKTGREDIRNNGATSKHRGPLKPAQFNKTSRDYAYSSLVEVNPPYDDFKISEGRLKRSNSQCRVYSKERFSYEQQRDTSVYKEELIVKDWLWDYMKEIHKSDIDTWCSEVELTEEKQYNKIVLKLKATHKPKLTLTLETIQLLYWKLDISIIRSSFGFAGLGVQGPDDSALVEWCDLFRKCSSKISLTLEKDSLVLLYPKEIQARVLQEHNLHKARRMKSSSDAAMPDNGQSSSQDRLEPLGNDRREDYIAEHKQSFEDKWLPKPNHDSSCFIIEGEEMAQTNSYRTNKDLDNEKYFLVGGMEPLQGITRVHEAFLDNPVQGFLGEKSPHPKERQDFSEETDRYTSIEEKTNGHGPYTSELLTQASTPHVQARMEAHYGEQGISPEDHVGQYQNSPSEQTPCQESDMMDSICDQCKNSGKTVQLSSGHLHCIQCYAASIITALNKAAKGTIRASITHAPMSLRLPGYERDTSFKIIYEVEDGVQGSGDPQPGCEYKGGTFEAYLPDNREGRKLLSLLEKALDQGLIFHIKTFGTEEKVTWHKIPHKTSPDGGKSKNGYPDSTYMKTTIALLKDYGIE